MFLSILAEAGVGREEDIFPIWRRTRGRADVRSWLVEADSQPGGWTEVKKMRLKGSRFKGDERILGDSDFVNAILAEANEESRGDMS